jgi:prepilin peptidase CpaA
MLIPFSAMTLGLLLVTAWRDVVTRTIPNTIGLLLVATGVIARIVNGGPSALALSAGTALLLFVLLLLAYSRGFIGGGDVKIMTALAVGLSPLDCYIFVIATAIAGGFLGICYLLLSRRLAGIGRRKRTSLLGRVVAIEFWRIRRHRSLPYGVAIAAGGAFVLLHTGNL